MENTAVYRARLNGGEAALTPSADLHRGSWSPSYAQATPTSAGPTRGPIPYSQLTPTGPDSGRPTSAFGDARPTPQP